MTLPFLDRKQLDALVAWVNDDPEFRLCARSMRAVAHFGSDAEGASLKVYDGCIVAASVNAFLEPWDFSVSGAQTTWQKMLSPIPPPDFHHLYAAMFRRHISFSGNLEAAFAYLAPLSRVVTLMRAFHNRPEAAHGHV